MNVSYTGSSMKLSRAVAGTGWYAATKSVNLIQDQLYKITVKVNNVSNMSPSQPAGSNILFFGYENSDGTPWLDYSEGITGTAIGTYTYYVIPKTNSGAIFLGVNNGGGGNFECEIGNFSVEHVAAAFQPLYTAVLNNATDYYAFGSPMPGRNYVGSSYKYGFNGQLKDDEVYGAGNLNSAEYWEYDTRLGRRWNRDPIVKDWESPYACFSDNPIYYADPLGLSSSTVTPKGGSVEFPLNKAGQAVVLDEVSVAPGPGTGGGRPAPGGTPIESPGNPSNPRISPPSNSPKVGPLVGAAALATAWYATSKAFEKWADMTDMSTGEYDMYGPQKPLPAIKWDFDNTHGNRRDNPEQHIVYELYGTDKNTNEKVVLKYGISNYSRRGYARPKEQLAKLRVKYAGDLINIDYNVLIHTQGRAAALIKEKELVTEHYKNYFPSDRAEGLLPEQRRPTPDIFEY